MCSVTNEQGGVLTRSDVSCIVITKENVELRLGVNGELIDFKVVEIFF